STDASPPRCAGPPCPQLRSDGTPSPCTLYLILQQSGLGKANPLTMHNKTLIHGRCTIATDGRHKPAAEGPRRPSEGHLRRCGRRRLLAVASGPKRRPRPEGLNPVFGGEASNLPDLLTPPAADGHMSEHRLVGQISRSKAISLRGH